MNEYHIKDIYLVLQPGAGLKNNDKMKDSRPKHPE